ncbi:MAG: xylulokinase [Actinobacteria bacterium]|nr:xylulokinase [Actinomycetota bacterium]MBL7124360.1 xylulokinase [Actinomycetota bacterium]
MAHLISFDIGTSSTRCILINEDGKLIASAIKEYPLFTPKPGWAEQDPEDWWKATVFTIKEVLTKSKINPSNIAAIGLSGQMHGSVFLDKGGKVIRPAILWCDQRTEAQCKEIYDIFGYEGFIKLSYNQALTGFTAPKILWLKEVEPENYKKVIQILLPKDFIRYKLSGEYATEVSDASGTILLDIKKRDWSKEILSGLSINKSLLPKVYESSEITSYLSAEAAKITCLKAGIPIVGGAGDQAGGAVGSGIVSEGLISDYLGTSGVVFAYSDSPVYDPQGRLHSFCHAIPNKWHLMGVTLAAAGSFKWYHDTIGPQDYDILNQQAGSVSPGSEGLIFLPYLSGERTPYNDPYARGVFFGLSYAHTKNHMARSVMEGVAFSQYDCLNLMNELGIKSDKVILFGGGARSKLWRQIISDIFSITIVTLNVEEGPSYGAAILAGVGAGIYKTVKEAADRIIKEVNRTSPNSDNVKKYRKYYKSYRSLYQSLKGEFFKII